MRTVMMLILFAIGMGSIRMAHADRVGLVGADQDDRLKPAPPTKGVSEPEKVATTHKHKVPFPKGDKSGPIWSVFYRNFKKCEPGCEPEQFGIFRDVHETCHNQRRAIDVTAMSCDDGKTYVAIKEKKTPGRFTQMVHCMDRKMPILWHQHKGRGDTLDHWNHCHFSLGCNIDGVHWTSLLASEPAYAAEAIPPGFEVKDPAYGRLKIDITEQIEPVYQPLGLKVSALCNDRRKHPNAVQPKLENLIGDQSICDLGEHKFDEKTKILTLHYFTSELAPGPAECNTEWKQTFNMKEICSAWN